MRTLPVTRFDELSAAIELGYLTDSEQTGSARDIASGTRPAVTARLSDQLWQRYGADSIALGFLAVLDEVCAATGRPAIHGNTFEAVLATAMSPCGRPIAPLVPLRIGKASVCIVMSQWDTVTPATLTQQALQDASTNIRWVTSDEKSHRSNDGLSSCLPH